MKIFRGLRHPGIAPACALTVGNFDGVHLGHQAMLALLRAAAEKHGVPSCVLTFEPHPRDWFASAYNQPDRAPARISTLRDKLTALAACGVEQVVILPFNERQAGQSAQSFIDDVLVRALGVRHVLIGDDFRFGARRAGDAAMLEAAGRQRGFEVARMDSHEVHGLRVSSTAVREALAAGDMERAAALLGRPYSISGHVVHGRCLGRALSESAPGRGDGFRTLNLRFSRRTAAWRQAAFLWRAFTGFGQRRWMAWRIWAYARRWTRTTSTAGACCWKCTRCAGLRRWAPRGATLKSSAWIYCTNCTTNCAITRWRRWPPAFPAIAPLRATGTRATRRLENPPPFFPYCTRQKNVRLKCHECKKENR